MASASIAIPGKFGGVRPIDKPHVARCAECGDFGTVPPEGAQREPRTIILLMAQERPCTCAAGRQWQEIFQEWQA